MDHKFIEDLWGRFSESTSKLLVFVQVLISSFLLGQTCGLYSIFVEYVHSGLVLLGWVRDQGIIYGNQTREVTASDDYSHIGWVYSNTDKFGTLALNCNSRIGTSIIFDHNEFKVKISECFGDFDFGKSYNYSAYKVDTAIIINHQNISSYFCEALYYWCMPFSDQGLWSKLSII